MFYLSHVGLELLFTMTLDFLVLQQGFVVDIASQNLVVLIEGAGEREYSMCETNCVRA